jgi:membrane protein DedA with SNARE-associated domain
VTGGRAGQDDGVGHAVTLALHLQIHRHVRGPRLDYLALALAVAIGWAGVPGPGEAALIAAGVAASRGHLDIAAAIAAAWAGATVGGIAGWAVGRAGGRRVVLAGRWLLEARESALARGNRFFERYGLIAVYFAPSWVAGINAMSAARFVPATAVCALLWTLLVGGGSYLVGPSVRDLATDIGLVGSVAIVLALAVTVLTRRRWRRRA